MRIDAHQHFWRPSRIDYPWMAALRGEAARRLVRPVLPSELSPTLARHGVERTVLVQAAECDEEGDFLLALAERHTFIAGAVVWLDMERGDFEVQLSRRAAHPKFLGVRPMIQDIEDPRWMLRPSVLSAFAVLERRQVCFDFLIKPHQLEPAIEVLDRFPGLRAVIDHLAKPAIARGAWQPWAEQIERVSQHSDARCKLSGMITEADHERWTAQDLSPYIAHAVRCFGAARCMFGSDWPVCTLAGSYDRVVEALEAGLARLGLTPDEHDSIFGGTAAEFYRI